MPDHIPEEYAGIFQTGNSLDRQLLASIASPYIQIYVDDGKVEIAYKKDAQKLTNRQKILVYLLGRKILKDTGKISNDEKEGLTPAELEEQTHITGGSIRPSLRDLLQERLVQKDGSHYYVPNYSLSKVSQELEAVK